jgi:hypothetical protein
VALRPPLWQSEDGLYRTNHSAEADELAALRRRFWLENLSETTWGYVLIVVLVFTLLTTIAVSQQLLRRAHPLLRIALTICCGIGVPYTVGLLFGLLSMRFWY